MNRRDFVKLLFVAPVIGAVTASTIGTIAKKLAMGPRPLTLTIWFPVEAMTWLNGEVVVPVRLPTGNVVGRAKATVVRDGLIYIEEVGSTINIVPDYYDDGGELVIMRFESCKGELLGIAVECV